MGGTFTVPGPETLILFGVHVKVLSAIFGVAGVLLGHLMAPVVAEPLAWRRHAAVIVAGVLLSLAMTIGTGQRPLVILSWSIGIGFAGITIFQGWAEKARTAARTIGSAALEEITERFAAPKDKS
jgi:hypothetical protein